ncbi:hypothetical protein GDO86_000048 [Hymenochirus boettgeri]|uniref:Zinc finger protein 638 n=1 Tax=Hymenochirus boettgeri TaxID=247094 RepID=A0A8T2KCZ5_9PIPI|nr:hypothetical protein GDO86_000048 [Hymenochirus boettgeri]
MFNPRGGFPVQRQQQPNHPMINQPGMNLPGMNISGMNHPGIMNTSPMNHPGMGHSAMNLPGLGHSGMNLNRMAHPAMNQGGMGFLSEMKSPGFGMRSHGMDPPGSFLGGPVDSIGLKGLQQRGPIHGTPERIPGPQSFQHRFANSGPPIHPSVHSSIHSSVQPVQQRLQPQNPEISGMNMLLKQSPSELHLAKDKIPLREPARHLGNEKPWETRGGFGNIPQTMSVKSVPSQVAQLPDKQNRYTNESASSILESFGLSNEDLEELSHYPDDQLTPANMPVILRDIRMRKVSRPGPPEQSAGRRSVSEVLPSKVIDYGHSSKYQFNEDSVPVRSFDSSRKEENKKLPPPQQSKRMETQKHNPPSKPAPPVKKQPEKPTAKIMENKIPTISVTRQNQRSAKQDRQPNKNIVVEQPKIQASNSEVPLAERPPANTANQSEVPTVGKPDAQAASYPEGRADHIPTLVTRGNYQPPSESSSTDSTRIKGNWTPGLSLADVQKMKRLPTPSMMNDYYAASPRIFPHICSLCNIECSHLKDWIKHQNTPAHIESCRQLRQQYPEWNPHELSGLRDDKGETAPNRSKSRSTSPRRSRRSGSRHRARRSRSRSPRLPGRVRTRSRSPKRARRSPKRSRSPRRRSRSPRRSPSPRRPRQARSSRTSSNSPDKRAIDAAVQSFIDKTEQKNSHKPGNASSNGKRSPHKPAPSNFRNRKPSASAASVKRASSICRMAKKPASSSNIGSARKTNNTRNPSGSNNSAHRPGGNSSYVKRPGQTKPVVSTRAKKPGPAGLAAKRPLQSRYGGANSNQTGSKGSAKQSPVKEPFTPLHKFKNKANAGKIIHVTNLPDTGYTDQDILKIVQPFGKVCDILIVRSKNEEVQKGQENVKAPQVIPPGFVKRFKLTEPPMKDADKCVILISNLPETPVTVDELCNLAKPFGGVNDVLLISSHRKAFLLLASKNSVDSMIKFYNVFPSQMSGNVLSISMAPKYKDLKDEERIFADLIEQTQYGITPSIYEKFVCLVDLPEKGYTDMDVGCIGLRFGKVEHYVIFSNKRKAILHMCSASAAKTMHGFLSQYPCTICESTVKCVLPSKKMLQEDEYELVLEEEKTSWETESNVDETEVAQSAEELALKAETGAKCDAANTDTKPLEETQAVPVGSPLHINVACVEEETPMSVEDSTKEQNLQEEPEIKIEVPDLKIVEEMELPIPEPDPTPVLVSESGLPVDLGVEASVENEEEEEEEEEAAEAPDLDVTSPVSSAATDPMEEAPQPQVQTHTLTPEDLEVMVSVESECEEDEVAEPVSFKDHAVKPQEPELNMADKVVIPSEELTNNKASSETNAHTITAAFQNEPLESYAVEDSKAESSVTEDNDQESKHENKSRDQSHDPKNNSTSLESNSQIPSLDILTRTNTLEAGVNNTEQSGLDEKRESNSKQPKADMDSPNRSKSRSSYSKQENSGNRTRTDKHFSERHSDSVKSHAEKRTKSDRDSKDRDSVKSKQAKADLDSSEKNKDSPTAIDSKDVLPSDKRNSHGGRTAKYNPQRGEISVTVTLEGQKCSKTDPRKRTSAEKSSGRESSTPKSSSSRSSPSELSASKSSTGLSQKRGSGRSVSSGSDKESRLTSRSLEKETRSSNRKDDRSKDDRAKDDRSKNSSSRYQRSFKPTTRASKSEEEDTFPFNLDEFVTVDEIVEDHVDTKPDEEDSSVELTASSKEKRENEQSSVETNKAKGKSPEAKDQKKELSYVTLDEVGDEDDGAAGLVSVDSSGVTKNAQTLLTVDEVHAEDEQLPVKDPQMLMTLDEISDEEDGTRDSSTGHTPLEIPEGFVKEQLLLTLDEIGGEEEEPNSSESSLQAANLKDEENKVEPNDTDMKEIDLSAILEDPQIVDQVQSDPKEQPLLTLDEVKGDDDTESVADITFNEAHQFFTVDEIGEEEEDSTSILETKTEVDKKPEGKNTPKVTDRKKPSGTTPRRGRPRKRPLPEESKTEPTESTGKKDKKDTTDSSTDTSSSAVQGSDVKSSMESKGKGSSGSLKSKGSPDSALVKSCSGDSKADTSETKSKLSPYNASIPIGMEFLVPRTGFFCELCSLFYMDEASKLKHCRSLRHYQSVEKHMAKDVESSETNATHQKKNKKSS